MERITNEKIQSLYEKLKDTKTVFGLPWLGNIPLMGGESIIFGPDGDGNYVYVFYMGEKLNVSYTQGMDFIFENRRMLKKKMNDAEKSQPDNTNSLSRAMYAQTLIYSLYDIIEEQDECLIPISEAYGENHGQVYRAEWQDDGNEHKIEFTDLSKNPVSKAVSKMPLGYARVFKDDKSISYSVENADNACLFKKDGKEYARYEAPFNLLENILSIDTPDGILKVIPTSDIVGKSLIIMMNSSVIGSFCYDLNAGFIDIIDQRYAVHVRDEKMRDLVFLFASMVLGAFYRENRNSEKV